MTIERKIDILFAQLTGAINGGDSYGAYLMARHLARAVRAEVTA